MHWSRKLVRVVMTGAIAVGLIPLGGCQRQETKKTTVQFQGPNSEKKVTVETKSNDRDRD